MIIPTKIKMSIEIRIFCIKFFSVGIYKEQTKKEADGMHRIMKIEGMTCGHCAQRVESLLNKMENVSAKVYLEENAADVDAGAGVSDEALRAVVENAGFQVTFIG